MQKIRKDKRLGENIRAMRTNLHLTQDDVVAKLQVAGSTLSRSAYSQIECGTYNIRVSELAVLRQIFGVDYNAFFEGIDIPDIIDAAESTDP